MCVMGVGSIISGESVDGALARSLQKIPTLKLVSGAQTI